MERAQLVLSLQADARTEFYTQIKRNKYENPEDMPQFHRAGIKKVSDVLDPRKRSSKHFVVRKQKLNFFILPIACKSPFLKERTAPKSKHQLARAYRMHVGTGTWLSLASLPSNVADCRCHCEEANKWYLFNECHLAFRILTLLYKQTLFLMYRSPHLALFIPLSLGWHVCCGPLFHFCFKR